MLNMNLEMFKLNGRRKEKKNMKTTTSFYM